MSGDGKTRSSRTAPLTTCESDGPLSPPCCSGGPRRGPGYRSAGGDALRKRHFQAPTAVLCPYSKSQKH